MITLSPSISLHQGVTIVISPLISLIQEQVSTLINLGVPAAFLTSNCSEKMKDAIYDDLAKVYGNREPGLKLLYTTPESLVKSDRMKTILEAMYEKEMIARFVIDEAHCVSSWGHDFRKEYGNLGVLKERYADVKILALTATARKKVADDVCRILGMTDALRISCGYDRPNLLFEVRPKPASFQQTLERLLDYILSYCNSTTGTTGIVYCMTKKECERTADFLRDNNLRADYYHAGQTNKDREMIQTAWLRGDIDIVCATIAYGMGIDKPDVRYVVHTSLAKSIEGYYQEAGRAGRDGGQSECVLFYKPSDVGILYRLMSMNKFKLAAREVDRLEEMKNYCEEEITCRRKIFANAFGDVVEGSTSRSSSVKGKENSKNKLISNPALPSSSTKFVPCGDMCDNCNAKKGIPRRGRDENENDNDDHDNKARAKTPKKRKVEGEVRKATFQTAAQMKSGISKSTLNLSSKGKIGHIAPIDLCDSDGEEIFSVDDLENDGLELVNAEVEEVEVVDDEWDDHQNVDDDLDGADAVVDYGYEYEYQY